MKSRRLMPNTGLPPPRAGATNNAPLAHRRPVGLTFSLPRAGKYVLGADLNRSESSRQPACPRLFTPAATSKPLMMRFIIAAPDDATLSRRNPQFRISISGSAFDDLRYQRISEAACDRGRRAPG